jgi:hypothetical protein
MLKNSRKESCHATSFLQNGINFFIFAIFLTNTRASATTFGSATTFFTKWQELIVEYQRLMRILPQLSYFLNLI